MKKEMRVFGAILFASTILTSCGGGGVDPTACDCANLYTGKFNPSNIEYSAEELNSGSKMQDDVDQFVEIGRACVMKYGELTDIDKELVKDSKSLSTMPNIDQAIDKAKQECK